ncbi:hypothetical protein AX15_003316 [Amanita polypyramis BW_CC]|nr:hypothetical protein AX15_003316 [Amanita polypyramis BW_CC]
MHLPRCTPDGPTHSLQIALRVYPLALSLSLAPSLLPFVVALVNRRRLSDANLSSLKHVLRRELGYDGFAMAITLAIAGGAGIRCLWYALDNKNVNGSSAGHSSCDKNQSLGFPLLARLRAQISNLSLSEVQKTFVSTAFSSALGFVLLQTGRRRWRQLQQSKYPGKWRRNHASQTLDLTVLLFVRAIDIILRRLVLRTRTSERSDHHDKVYDSDLLEKLLSENEKQKPRDYSASRIDAFIFWACSARIMWCFFYEPERLPRSYVKWIGTLANLDDRLLQALKLLRDGKRWSYMRSSAEHTHLLMSYAQDLGHPKEWGDPSRLPSYGGQSANAVWRALGVNSRPNVGGLPCEVVHGGVGRSFGLSSSCTANALLRGVSAFMKAIALYLPAHFLPLLLTRPKSLLHPLYAVTTLMAAFRSAAFLSTFVASFWYAVCFTRTLVLARLFPSIPHDFWDGPRGCLLIGSLICGNSIWTENGRRRGEMALYVLPRALRTCLPNPWVKEGNRVVLLIECIIFIVSFSTLLTAAIHHPDTLRGLSRWTLTFVINGPNIGFWRRKRQNPSVPPTPTTTNATGRNDIFNA